MYFAKSRIDYGEGAIAAGATVDLDALRALIGDEAVVSLLDGGDIVADAPRAEARSPRMQADAPPAEPPADPPDSPAVTRAQALRRASDSIIARGDAQDLTSSGKVSVSALERESGVEDVTAAERDAAGRPATDGPGDAGDGA